MSTTLIIIITAVVSIVLTAIVVGASKKNNNSKAISSDPTKSINVANPDGYASNMIDEDSKKKIAELEKQLEESNKALKQVNSNTKDEEYKEKIAKLEKKLAKTNEELDNALKSSSSFDNGGNGAEVGKLKAKIKKLEDDLEEAEDDADSLKKKIKRVEAEKNEAVDNAEREIKKAKSELTDVTSQLESANKQIKLNDSSLSFVQEIMSAEKADSKDYTATLDKIDDLKDFINIDLRSFLKDHVKGFEGTQQWDAIFGSKDTDPLSQWAEVAKKSWVKGKVKIAFVGEFSAGKTSIVNRILSQDNPNVPKLPVSTKATTAIPTYISKGITDSYNFFSPANELKQISAATFNTVSHEILDKVKGISSLIKYFVMRYNNPNLEGLSILDTPGFSHDSEDNGRTIDVINECDALFWVIDVNNGTINRSSLDLIAKRLKKPLYVVINKVDSKSASEVKSVENLVTKTFSDKGMTVQKIIKFSQKENLSEMMDTIKSIRRDDNSEQYLSMVKKACDTFLSQFNNAKGQSRTKHTQARKNVEEWENYFYNVANQMIDNAANMLEIPHYEEHFFSSNKYEMESYEYDRFYGLCCAIADHKNNDSNVRQIENSFHGFKEAGEAETKALDELHDITSECKDMENIIKKLNKLINDYNNVA